MKCQEFKMDYLEFKNEINNTELSSEEFYKSLIGKLSGLKDREETKELIHSFYEKYIDEECNIEYLDKIDNFDKVEYYLKITEEHFMTSEEGLYNEDPFKQYINYVNYYLDQKFKTNMNEKITQENIRLFGALDSIVKEMKEKNITFERMSNFLKKKYKIDLIYKNLKEINKKIEEIENIKFKTRELESILKDLYFYAKYEKIVEEIMENNARIVIKIVLLKIRKISETGLEKLDLLQEGQDGLRKAVEKFDVSKGFKFSTYAYGWINQSIGRGIANQSKTIRLPVHVNERYQKIKKAISNYVNIYFKEPSNEEIAKLTGFTLEQVNDILSGFHIQPTSLDLPVGGDGEDSDTTLGEMIPDSKTGFEDYNHLINKNQLIELLKETKSLTARERVILTLRFGLGLAEYIDFNLFMETFDEEIEFEEKLNKYNEACSEVNKEFTLEECGKIYNVTRERIRQIEAKGLRKLRKQSLSSGKMNQIKKAKVYKKKHNIRRDINNA